MKRIEEKIILEYSDMEDFQRGIHHVYEVLESKGFAIIQAWDKSRATFKDICEYFGYIQNHPNADEQGVIDVMPGRKKKHESYERFISKTSGEFLPHTDGAYLDGYLVLNGKVARVKPPSVVVLQCVRPAQHGGVSTLVDTQDVFRRLISDSPQLFRVLSQPRTISHCAEKHFSSYSPICEQLSAERWRIRLRTDLMYIEPSVCKLVKDAIDRYLHNPDLYLCHPLTEGQILVIDNYRMLHGRSMIDSVFDDSGKCRFLHKAWIWDPDIDYLNGFYPAPPDPDSFKSFGMHHPLGIEAQGKQVRPIKTGIYL